MKNYPLHRYFAIILISSISLLATGCTTSETASSQVETIPSVEVIKPGAVASGLTASGKILPDQEVQVVAKISGKVASVRVSEGAKVKKGEELIQLEEEDYALQVSQAQSGVLSTQAKLADVKAGTRKEEIQALQAGVEQAKASLEQTKANVEQAKAALDLAEKSYQRTKSLFESGAIPQAELDRMSLEWEKARTNFAQAQAQEKSMDGQLDASQAKLNLAQSGPTLNTIQVLQAEVGKAQSALDLAENALSHTSVKSPMDGIIVQRNIEPGELAQPGTPLLTLVKMDQVKIEVSLPQEHVNEVKPGDVVMIDVAGLGNQTIEGKLQFVSPVSDPNTSTFPIKVLVDNQQGLLKSGMIAQVSFTGGQQSDWEVPASALFTKDNVTYLYVVKDDILHQTAVTVKPKNKEWVYVTDGLERNDLVVLHPTQKLGEGIKVQVEKGV